MPLKFLTAYVLTFLCISGNAQLYHPETGKVIPTSKSDTVIWTTGVFNHYYADFGTLIAHENRLNRNSKLITIPIVRVKAYDLDSVSYPIFILNGGPGESNLNPALIDIRLLRYHDFVFVGYRGVDGSVCLDCEYLAEKFNHNRINKTSFKASIKQGLDSCISKFKLQNIETQGYTMDAVVGDIHAVKQSLAYDSLAFLAFSYGTMLAQDYYYHYPDKVNRMVLIGARPMGDFEFYPDLFKEQIKKIYTYYFKDTLVSGFKNYTDFLQTVQHILLVLSSGKDKDPLYLYLFSQLYTAQNIKRTFLMLKKSALAGDDLFYTELNKFYKNYPGELVLGDLYLKKQGYVTRNRSLKGLGLSQEICRTINAYFNPQHPELIRLGNSLEPNLINIPVLLLSGELDVAAPPELINQQLLPIIPNSKQLIIPKFGHLNLVINRSEMINSKIEEFFGTIYP